MIDKKKLKEPRDFWENLKQYNIPQERKDRGNGAEKNT